MVSWAVEDGRVTLVVEPEAAAAADGLAADKLAVAAGPAVQAAGAPDVQAPSATTAMTATASRRAREPDLMGVLIWRG
jgi:hypothetical protein